jgi:thiol-disulfide isomerase/thioredoxin
MKRETFVNTIMVAIVMLLTLGSGFMVEKNLHDKEVRERQAALEAQKTVAEKFERVAGYDNDQENKNNGFIMYKGKMLKTIGEEIYAMNMNIILPGGTKVLTTGRIIQDDGKDFHLQDGEMINYKGQVVKTTRNLVQITPLIEPNYDGTVIAGIVSPYLAFNQTDFEKAKKEGKTILLVFFSSWCESCVTEEKALIDGFNGLRSEKFVGFKVHYKDPQATDVESMLAKQYDVNKEDTKIILQDNKQVFRTESPFDQATFNQEVNKVL